MPSRLTRVAGRRFHYMELKFSFGRGIDNVRAKPTVAKKGETALGLPTIILYPNELDSHIEEVCYRIVGGILSVPFCCVKWGVHA
jgi:hypothetical protein